jgi:DNA polymerase I-like protein with 3'-5' exonuclease and polymerase domains
MSARFDSVGMWWQDFPEEKLRASVPRPIQVVAVPETGWRPHRQFPNLSGAKLLGLDTETKDLEIDERGPGAVRGAAHMVGFSLATEDKSWYFPIRHEYEPQGGMNLDADNTIAWLGEQLQQRRPLVGANLLYDLEILRNEGIRIDPKTPLLDVQLSEPLLDEQRYSYALESLAQIHLGTGKESSALYDWCAASFGGISGPKQRANIWRAPPSLVGHYAESDALLPLKILEKQRPLLKTEGLEELFEMECGLIPLLLDMRFRGVRIDEAKAQITAKWLREQAAIAQAKIPGVDVWSAKSIERAFQAAGCDIAYTEAGNPSFTKGWLEAQEHALAQNVLDVRLYEKAANPFVESYLLQNLYNGRVHCLFHPMRSDDYGTVSGRFSSSNPNLQNIPSRHKIIGPAIRSLYIPEEGCIWQRLDYSQIEYRALLHYAIGKGAEELRDRYRNDPNTDFHELTIAMVEEVTGVKLDRKPAKNLNFGLVYGMGEEKVTRSLGISPDVGARLYKAYFTALPCVKETSRGATRLAARRGYIHTFLGRRRRFTNFEQGRFGQQRVGTHAALNACLQGTAADIIKKGMLLCYRAGLFAEDACGIPHLTVHDELDWSRKPGPKAAQAFVEVKRIMENCVKLKVPLLAVMSTGATWGECI